MNITEYLKINYNMSKNNVKSLIKKRLITVNNNIITTTNTIIHNNDNVTILKIYNDIPILYEDKYIIVVNKPAGILTIANDKEKYNTLYNEISNYLKKQNKKVFIIHRLDKETSGIIIFAKDKKTKELYQKNWNNLIKKRGYIAIVAGKTKNKDTIKSYLKENSNHMVYSSKEGKLAISDYIKIKSNNKYTMLQVYIKTGRKNQIRVHLSENNTPIIGDKKYYSKENPIKRLGLHANELEFINPINNKIMKFRIDIPDNFESLFN